MRAIDRRDIRFQVGRRQNIVDGAGDQRHVVFEPPLGVVVVPELDIGRGIVRRECQPVQPGPELGPHHQVGAAGAGADPDVERSSDNLEGQYMLLAHIRGANRLAADRLGGTIGGQPQVGATHCRSRRRRRHVGPCRQRSCDVGGLGAHVIEIERKAVRRVLDEKRIDRRVEEIVQFAALGVVDERGDVDHRRTPRHRALDLGPEVLGQLTPLRVARNIDAVMQFAANNAANECYDRRVD